MLIAAQGQVSNVGSTSEGTCAAQRAGISRLSPLPSVTAYEPDELEGNATGAPIRGLTDGFFHNARWVVLGIESLVDLARTRGVALDDASYWRSTALVWVLPELEFERFNIPETRADEFLGLACTQVFLSVSRLPLTAEQVHFVAAGVRGLSMALDKAETLLGRGGVQRVIVVATDSLVDPLSLMWLQAEGRLKSPENPTGLCPGESGVCLVLRAAPEPAGPPPAARILAWSASQSAEIAEVPEPEETEDAGAAAETEAGEETDSMAARRTEAAPDIGRALAEAIERALAKAGVRAPFRGDLILDLNGENWRALVWGHAQVRLQRIIDFAGSKVVVPATSFGDIGAAGAAAGLCIAAQAFARGYASGTHAIVASVSDRGEVSAIVVGAALT